MDNERFLRLWEEVNWKNACVTAIDAAEGKESKKDGLHIIKVALFADGMETVIT